MRDSILFSKASFLAAISIVVVARTSTAQEPEKLPDLTGLSLQELYNMETIQLNVLGAHTHPSGEFMVGYHYMYMQMEDYRDGTRSLTPQEVLDRYGYPTVHERMRMEMHMIEGMYAFTDKLTVMAMVPYKTMEMDHLMNDGHRFTQHADGLGDVEAMVLYTLFGSVEKGYRLVINAGMSFPTGSVDTRDHREGNAALRTVRLEYPMQLGSGTYDPIAGLTYLGDHEDWSWGAQGTATVRLGKNENEYSFGNLYRGTIWAAYGVTDWFAPYLRAEGRRWGKVDGRDPELNPAANPEANPDNQGGERVDILAGLNFYAPRGFLKGTRVILEGGVPVYERLEGPQISTAYMITAGITYSF